MNTSFLQNLKFKLDEKEITLPVAIADSDDVPLILGRVGALDLFDARFSKGEKLTLSWEA